MAVARNPRLHKSGITLAHDEPSAQAPCTRMILDALVMLLASILRPFWKTILDLANGPVLGTVLKHSEELFELLAGAFRCGFAHATRSPTRIGRRADRAT